MNFISKIPRPLLIAALATIGFILTNYVTDGLLYRAVPMSWLEFVLFLFIKNLSGVVVAIIIWLGLGEAKNAWATAIITGFAMLISFILLSALIGAWLGYIALLFASWALLVGIGRIFSVNTSIVLKFSSLFVLCLILWYIARMFASWLLMRAV